MSTIEQQSVSTTTGSTVAHTTVAENVAVRTVVSTEARSNVNAENVQKVAALLNKLGTTHQQIDEYSRRRTEQISEGVLQKINDVVVDTQAEQTALLVDANARAAAVEDEYKVKLQLYVEELDAAKAQNLSVLEKDLNFRQELILDEAKKRIDELNSEANRLKEGILREAQAQANAQTYITTERMATLAAQDATRLLSSSQTTVITTEARTN